jgi:hypothetical protein
MPSTMSITHTTERPIKNGESRETANIEYTRRGKPKQQHNTRCVGHHYAQTKTNNVDNTRALLQTNGGKDEPNIVSLLHVEGIIRRMYTSMSYTHC